jgi:polar amino acid transport system substrate-binding protein
MRKIALIVVVFALVTAACSKKTPSGTTATPPSGSASVALTATDCAQGATFLNSGTLTIGKSDPAYPPYFQGGTTKDSSWTLNDPTTGKGFESAVAYEVATRLGFTADQVTWVQVKFTQSYAPGPKPFDLDIDEGSYKPKRAEAVDFSESYYDLNQAVVAVKGTPITMATSLADLQPYTLAAPLGTTSYDTITDVIQTDADPGVYQSQADAVAAINAGQVDGLVVDYPTALYMADPYVQQVHNSVVVGQIANPEGAEPEHYGIVLEKGSALTACVDQALAEMKDDGTLQAITTKWLSKKTNVGEVPVFSS